MANRKSIFHLSVLTSFLISQIAMGDYPPNLDQIAAAVNLNSAPKLPSCRLNGRSGGGEQYAADPYPEVTLFGKDDRKFCSLNDSRDKRKNAEFYSRDCIDNAGIIHCYDSGYDYSSTGMVLNIPLECLKPDKSGIEERKVLVSAGHSYFTEKNKIPISNCKFDPGGVIGQRPIAGISGPESWDSAYVPDGYTADNVGMRTEYDYSFNTVSVSIPGGRQSLQGYEPLFLSEQQLLEKQNKEGCSIKLMGRMSRDNITGISTTSCSVHATGIYSRVDLSSDKLLVTDCDSMGGASGGGIILTCGVGSQQKKYLVGVHSGRKTEKRSDGTAVDPTVFDPNYNGAVARLFDPVVFKKNLQNYLKGLALQDCFIKGVLTRKGLESRDRNEFQFSYNSFEVDRILTKYSN